MENMNRKFWIELAKKYPLGFKVFDNWLIKYQLEHDWYHMFRVKGDGKTIPFDELPLGMQIGIYIEFVTERGGCSWEVDLYEMDWKEDMTKMCEMMQGDEEMQVKSRSINIYKCKEGHENVSVERVAGLTPDAIDCPECGRVAHSLRYQCP